MSLQLILQLSIVLPALFTQAQFNQQSLPLLADKSICAVPPGTLASDNLDDVCLLSKCCSDWVTATSATVKLSSGSSIACGHVICPNVCRMACDRQGSSEACLSACNASTSNDAYVFVRQSGAGGLGHVGFGFAIGHAFYMYGSLEDPAGAPYIPGSGQSNGFWLRNGTLTDMLCAFSGPPFGAPYDRTYKTTTAISPSICSAVQKAEGLFGAGYLLAQLGNAEGNCLNAVYDVLTAYGALGMNSPSNGLINGIPNQWYNNLDPTAWTSRTSGAGINCRSLEVGCQAVTCTGVCFSGGGCLVTTNTFSSSCLPDKGGDCSAYTPKGGTVLYCPPIIASPSPAPGPVPTTSK